MGRKPKNQKKPTVPIPVEERLPPKLKRQDLDIDETTSESSSSSSPSIAKSTSSESLLSIGPPPYVKTPRQGASMSAVASYVASTNAALHSNNPDVPKGPFGKSKKADGAGAGAGASTSKSFKVDSFRGTSKGYKESPAATKSTPYNKESHIPSTAKAKASATYTYSSVPSRPSTSSSNMYYNSNPTPCSSKSLRNDPLPGTSKSFDYCSFASSPKKVTPAKLNSSIPIYSASGPPIALSRTLAYGGISKDSSKGRGRQTKIIEDIVAGTGKLNVSGRPINPPIKSTASIEALAKSSGGKAITPKQLIEVIEAQNRGGKAKPKIRPTRAISPDITAPAPAPTRSKKNVSRELMVPILKSIVRCQDSDDEDDDNKPKGKAVEKEKRSAPRASQRLRAARQKKAVKAKSPVRARRRHETRHEVVESDLKYDDGSEFPDTPEFRSEASNILDDIGMSEIDVEAYTELVKRGPLNVTYKTVRVIDKSMELEQLAPTPLPIPSTSKGCTNTVTLSLDEFLMDTSEKEDMPEYLEGNSDFEQMDVDVDILEAVDNGISFQSIPMTDFSLFSTIQDYGQGETKNGTGCKLHKLGDGQSDGQSESNEEVGTQGVNELQTESETLGSAVVTRVKDINNSQDELESPSTSPSQVEEPVAGPSTAVPENKSFTKPNTSNPPNRANPATRTRRRGRRWRWTRKRRQQMEAEMEYDPLSEEAIVDTFWSFVDGFCRSTKRSELAALQKIINEHKAMDPEIFKIPPLGKHYKDKEEEKRDEKPTPGPAPGPSRRLGPMTRSLVAAIATERLAEYHKEKANADGKGKDGSTSAPTVHSEQLSKLLEGGAKSQETLTEKKEEFFKTYKPGVSPPEELLDDFDEDDDEILIEILRTQEYLRKLHAHNSDVLMNLKLRALREFRRGEMGAYLRIADRRIVFYVRQMLGHSDRKSEAYLRLRAAAKTAYNDRVHVLKKMGKENFMVCTVKIKQSSEIEAEVNREFDARRNAAAAARKSAKTTAGTTTTTPTASTSKSAPTAGTSKSAPIAGTSKSAPTAGTSKSAPTAGTSSSTRVKPGPSTSCQAN